MSKYLGSWQKKARALGFSFRRNKQEFSRGKKRTTPPGIHGNKRKRSSPYAVKLKEKQKFKYGYGWRNKQVKSEYIKARKKAVDAGVNLLIRSESRLDKLVFLSGLTNTLPFAREWVSHGHFLVNGRKVKTPSCKIEPGQVISLKKEKMKENKLIKSNLEKNSKVPPYLAFDKQKLTITYERYPRPEELDKDIDTNSVVEWFSRRI